MGRFFKVVVRILCIASMANVVACSANGADIGFVARISRLVLGGAASRCEAPCQLETQGKTHARAEDCQTNEGIVGSSVDHASSEAHEGKSGYSIADATHIVGSPKAGPGVTLVQDQSVHTFESSSMLTKLLSHQNDISRCRVQVSSSCSNTSSEASPSFGTPRSCSSSSTTSSIDMGPDSRRFVSEQYLRETIKQKRKTPFWRGMRHFERQSQRKLMEDEEVCNQLCERALLGDVEGCRSILLSGKCKDVNWRRPLDGNSPLHLAAEEGRLIVIKTLVANGADAEVVNSYGLKPVSLVPVGTKSFRLLHKLTEMSSTDRKNALKKFSVFPV